MKTLNEMYHIILLDGETFKEIYFEQKLRLRYAVSNKGRLMSFVSDINFGRILKGGSSDGYKTLTITEKPLCDSIKKTKTKTLFVYKLVAKLFLPKPTNRFDDIITDKLIHLDMSRDNDDVSNLKWVTESEFISHKNKYPKVIEWKKGIIEHNKNSDGRKLSVRSVRKIKRLLVSEDKKLTSKEIAKRFGVSEMQIYRIKSGKNWGHIKIY